MFCAKCGKPVGDTAQFCIYCGEKREIPPANPAPQPQPVVQSNPGIQRNPGMQPNPGMQGYPGMQGNPGMQGYPGMQPNPGMQYMPGYYPNPSYAPVNVRLVTITAIMIGVSILGGISALLNLYSLDSLFGKRNFSFLDVYNQYGDMLDFSHSADRKILHLISLFLMIFGCFGFIDYIAVLIVPGMKEKLARYVRINGVCQVLALLCGWIMAHDIISDKSQFNLGGWIVLIIIAVNFIYMPSLYNTEMIEERKRKRGSEPARGTSRIRTCSYCGGEIVLGNTCEKCGRKAPPEKPSGNTGGNSNGYGFRWPQ